MYGSNVAFINPIPSILLFFAIKVFSALLLGQKFAHDLGSFNLLSFTEWVFVPIVGAPVIINAVLAFVWGGWFLYVIAVNTKAIFSL